MIDVLEIADSSCVSEQQMGSTSAPQAHEVQNSRSSMHSLTLTGWLVQTFRVENEASVYS